MNEFDTILDHWFMTRLSVRSQLTEYKQENEQIRIKKDVLSGK